MFRSNLKNNFMDSLKATVDRLEADNAVLILEDGQKLIIPLKYLADNIKESDVVHLNISLNPIETEFKQKQAKDLLQEILKKQNESEGT
ncbi:MAG: DUF3006 family protein [Candidatus Buchananbacteria bacterium]|nr:DUF3006 family protein [Candidatus Buchananbacteria bacterium]